MNKKKYLKGYGEYDSFTSFASFLASVQICSSYSSCSVVLPFLDSHLQIFSSYTSVRSFVPAFNEQETTEQEEGDEQEEKTTRSWFISDLVFLFFLFCGSAFYWFVEVNVSETTEKDEQE